MTAPRRFAEIEIGDELPEQKPDVSLTRVRAFCRVVGAYTPRFTDHEGARKEGLPGAIVPGIMSQAMLAAIIHRWAPGAWIEEIDTVFRAPVLVDSHPVLRAAVTDLDPEARSVHIDLTIANEAGETRVMGTARVRLD